MPKCSDIFSSVSKLGRLFPASSMEMRLGSEEILSASSFCGMSERARAIRIALE